MTFDAGTKLGSYEVVGPLRGEFQILLNAPAALTRMPLGLSEQSNNLLSRLIC